MHRVYTIGYENATVRSFIDALTAAKVELVVDVRAVAGSRRPGFAKTRLAANLSEAGIGYLHLRGLGTPSDGRIAARAGRHAEMKGIFMEHMRSDAAQGDLQHLSRIVKAGERVCLLCLEADPTHCHRSMVAEALGELVEMEVEHLRPEAEE